MAAMPQITAEIIPKTLPSVDNFVLHPFFLAILTKTNARTANAEINTGVKIVAPVKDAINAKIDINNANNEKAKPNAPINTQLESTVCGLSVS